MTAWYWRRGPGAVAGAALLVPAMVYRLLAATHRGVYARGVRRRHHAGVPVIAVGNLSVGGTGKTPLTQWIAAWLAARGHRPGILLRGYGGDEAVLHREAVPGAVVVADGHRARGAARAVGKGADVLVLDDGFQHHALARDLDLVLVSADAADAVPWPLPAGPWREPWHALRRAGQVVVTRKAASERAVRAVAARVRRVTGREPAIAHLRLGGLRGLRSGRQLPLERLRGARVLAPAGIGNPDAFAAQLVETGARVSLRRRRDHHPWSATDVRDLLLSAPEVDYVVSTAKDAVKLKRHWPGTAPELLIAELQVSWERGRQAVTSALAHVCSSGPDPEE